MHFSYILILLFPLIRISYQSHCIVSEWGTWSECHGGCQKGLIVRNRDVLQPPLPELTPEGRTMQRLCPHLYETRYCDQSVCKKPNQVNYQHPQQPQPRVETQVADATSAKNLVEKQMKKVGFGNENDATQAELKRKFISETEQLFKLDDAINRRYGPQPSDHLVNNTNNTPIIDISTQQMSSRQWRDDKTTSPTTTTTTVVPEEYKGQRQLNTSRRHRPSNDHSVSLLLRKIEQALDTNQPLDEKYIKSAYRRNRKLSKILVDAYRQRQALMNSGELTSTYSSYTFTSTSTLPPTTKYWTYPTTTTQRTRPTTAPTTTTSTTTNPPIQFALEKRSTSSEPIPFVTASEEPTTDASGSTTTTPMLYWPKTGYVPNTRKHASDITNQLYMTNEIIQTLADDPLPTDFTMDCEHNKRCCKVIKNTCADGVDPKFVKRWYRPKGSSVCVPYHYPRCSSFEEMEELPILFEQNCQDLCFSKQEKRIAPLFTLEADDE